MNAKRYIAPLLAILVLTFFTSCNGPLPRMGGGNVSRTNKALMSLNMGMSKEQVYKLAGTAGKIEGYDWGSVWFYRTNSGADVGLGLDDDEKNFTPIVFDNSHRVTGFGQKFYKRTIQDLGTGQF
jgi:outer membrane protein assembly factor BamE (lipoprotein component of BamABCDE complex)|tara:strand:- start:220 stop:594 length:375 start_codon:yes stop_codon:yes gene_type:complete